MPSRSQDRSSESREAGRAEALHEKEVPADPDKTRLALLPGLPGGTMRVGTGHGLNEWTLSIYSLEFVRRGGNSQGSCFAEYFSAPSTS